MGRPAPPLRLESWSHIADDMADEAEGARQLKAESKDPPEPAARADHP